MAHERILVIDDDPSAAALVRRILLGGGYLPVLADSAEHALTIMSSNATPLPDLIIVDLKLPQMTGLEFAKRLRDVRCTIPIIAYTGVFDDPDLECEAFKAGCDGYVEKTGDIRLFAAVVALHLQRVEDARVAAQLAAEKATMKAGERETIRTRKPVKKGHH